MKKPKAVLISDIHFNLKTKEIAAKALSMAVCEAEDLNVPLIIAGDLHDTKAVLRGECITTIIDCLKDAKVEVFVLVGNHDKLHEKSEGHALEFLRPYVTLVQAPVYVDKLSAFLIPYQNDNSQLKQILTECRKHKISTLIMHQGFKGAFMGEYVKDESSIDPEEVKDFRVISGHYHRHQTIGTVTYIGSPYTTSFAEANDGTKGFIILNSDGSIEQVSTELRRHVIFDTTVEGLEMWNRTKVKINSDDLVWLKVTGSRIKLDKLNKRDIGEKIIGHQNFKLDKIATDLENIELRTDNLTDEEIMDAIIDEDNQTQDEREYLKALWRELLK